jgi:signal peptidase I
VPVGVVVVLLVAVPVAVVFVGGQLTISALGWKTFAMPGRAMAPTLIADDWFFVDTRAYKVAPPQRGDIVAVRAPPEFNLGPADNGAGPEIVKRVIGLPGDRIDMTPTGPVINGVAAVQEAVGDFPGPAGTRATRLRERLPDGTSYEIVKDQAVSPYDRGRFVVPAGCYFVLGDNRDDSIDSRSVVGRKGNWYVPAADFIGRATFIWWSAAFQFDRIGKAAK